MTRDIIEVNEFLVLIEESVSDETIVDKCGFQQDVIGFAFHGSGSVDLNVSYEDQHVGSHNTKGFAMSFYAAGQVLFEHTVPPGIPYQGIVIAAQMDHFDALPEQEKAFFRQYIPNLVNPEKSYIDGPNFFMDHDMQQAVHKIFTTTYKDEMRLLFLKSQVTELITHFFAHVSNMREAPAIKQDERDKLYQAQEILTENMDKPPSLNELSKMIGLNDYKLKKKFKEMFGLPVFKYLQDQRLIKAHQIISGGGMNVQEAAWFVGYESLSSFSSAFQQKFGCRPSEISK